MQVYVDGVKRTEVAGAVLDRSVSIAAGTRRRITVQAYDRAGRVFRSTVYIDVR
jgi:hypothetical protein